MRKFVFLLLLPLLLSGNVSKQDLYYAKTLKVERIEGENVTFTDSLGNLWEIEGAEDWAVGDFAAAVMDTAGTETIYDDTIVSIRYEMGF